MQGVPYQRCDGFALEPEDEEIVRHIESLTPWKFAPPDSVEVGIPVRVVTYDFLEIESAPAVRPVVLSGHVSHVDPNSDEFMLYVDTIEGNSGGVVLNERMQVIGMVIEGFEFKYRYSSPGVREALPSRTVAVHVDAIREKLCEWGYLTGRDCR